MEKIFGNFLSLVASILMVYAGTLLNKKKILYIEIIEIALFAISELIVGGWSGMVVNIIAVAVNFLCYKDKLNLPARIIITIITIIVFTIFNEFSGFGILLAITMLIYLWLMNVKNVKLFKLLLISYMIVWGIYDYSIGLYVSVIFDTLTILMNIVSIFKIIEKEKTTKKIKTKRKQKEINKTKE